MPRNYLQDTLDTITAPPKRKRLRFNRWQPITIRFKKETFDKLAKLAEGDNRSISGLVREVMEDYVRERTR